MDFLRTVPEDEFITVWKGTTEVICFFKSFFYILISDIIWYILQKKDSSFFCCTSLSSKILPSFCCTSLSSFFIRTIQDHCVYWHTAELCSFVLIALRNKPFFKENIGVTTSINFQKVNTSQTQKLSEYIIYIHVPVFDMS